MKQTYETDYRPNYELYLAANWGIGGTLCALVMIFYSGFTVTMTLALTSVFFVVAFYQGTFARARGKRMDKLERQELNKYSLDELGEQLAPEALFLGRGFEWTPIHAQKVADLYRDPMRLAEIKKNRKGATFLHGVGIEQEAPLYMLDNESKGHVHIVGTTGAGKTRLMDLFVAQIIMRNEPCIIIDPKGDHELKNNMEAAYRRAGRAKDFTFFHPAFVAESAAINPLATRQRGSELASRLAAVIPSSASGDVFQSFSQNALMGIFYAIEVAGTNPTIMDVQRALSEGFAPLCIHALEGWAYTVGPDMVKRLHSAMHGSGARAGQSPEKRAERGALFYQEESQRDRSLSSAEMNNLISLLLHDRDHFKKMVASLVPVVGKLCAGPLATLFSPDPTADRMPQSGKVISLEQVINNRGGVYIGLDTLSDPDVGRAMGQMILADLASLAGKNYNFGRDKSTFINVFVDEASEITNEQLIQLLNKGRGAGFRIFVATQTLADYEARTGSAAMASMLLGNMNSTIMLRTVDVDTQEKLAKRLPEVPISYIMKTTASSMGDASYTGAFAVNHGERLMSEDKPIIAPQSFGDLSDLEFFAIFAKGNLVKGRLPILNPPDEDYQAPRAEHYATQAKQIVYDHENHAANPSDETFTLHRERVERPPVLDVEEVAPYERPAPPHRRRLLPFINWVDVFPSFRASDKVPSEAPDSFVAASGLENERIAPHMDWSIMSEDYKTAGE